MKIPLIVTALILSSLAALTPSVSAQSAPALTELRVIGVASTKTSGNFESIAIGQTTTTWSHGGPQLRVATFERGYGNVPVATMIGGVLPASKNYLTTNLALNSSGQ